MGSLACSCLCQEVILCLGSLCCYYKPQFSSPVKDMMVSETVGGKGGGNLGYKIAIMEQSALVLVQMLHLNDLLLQR